MGKKKILWNVHSWKFSPGDIKLIIKDGVCYVWNKWPCLKRWWLSIYFTTMLLFILCMSYSNFRGKRSFENLWSYLPLHWCDFFKIFLFLQYNVFLRVVIFFLLAGTGKILKNDSRSVHYALCPRKACILLSINWNLQVVESFCVYLGFILKPG